MEEIKIDVKRQKNKITFSLSPSAIAQIKSWFPDKNLPKSIFYEIKEDIDIYVDIEYHIYTFLLETDDTELKGKVSKIVFIDTLSNKVLFTHTI
jgi:hypothetical protein